MRHALLVDAGYFYAALATHVTGSSNRAAVKVHEAYMIQQLVRQAQADGGGELLRVLWYDGAKGGVPDGKQQHIGRLDGVKLRMGRINPYGEQKGVDLRLGLDLVSMAVNRTIGTAYLVSGDDDLSEAVEDAQDLGLKVKVLAVPDRQEGQRAFGLANNLELVSDGLLLIDPTVIETGVTRRLVAQEEGAAGAQEDGEAAQGPPATGPGAATPEAPGTGRSAPGPHPGPPVTASPATPADPARPTPATLAGMHRAAHSRPQPREPESVLAYSSDGGQASPGGSVIPLERIQEVAALTARVWSEAASADEFADLVRGRPDVPPDIDRLLIMDLANACGVWDVPPWARTQLREEFWEAIAGLGRA